MTKVMTKVGMCLVRSTVLVITPPCPAGNAAPNVHVVTDKSLVTDLLVTDALIGGLGARGADCTQR